MATAGTALPWVEKYRPRLLKDVAHQEEVLCMLHQVTQTGNMPHLLFHGPPGTGKTSSVLALANELFGKEQRSERVKELNASDDRGIAAVREKVKAWSRFEPRNVAVQAGAKAPPPWKIVILDEADMMTSDAQSALRRIMEESSRSTRFVIICNYVHKIIEPLASRCSVYRFKAISQEAQIARLKYICGSENVKLADDGVLKLIHEITQGDLRRAVTLLQTASSFFDVLDKSTVLEIAGHPPITVSQSFISACRESVNAMESAVQGIHESGWDTSVITTQVAKLIIEGKDSDVQKARICLALAERDFAVLQNANSFLNMLAVGRLMCLVLGAKE